MGMRISTNIASINAQKTLASSQREIAKSFAQLSSGSRITKSADDAAGLAISENLKSQIRSFSQATRNANDGISMIQVAEGGLSEVSNILTRLRELGIQAASDNVGDTERGFMNKEVVQLKNEMERIAKTTRFGKTNLIDGTGSRFDIQVGINNKDFEDRISFDSSEMDATASTLGVEGLDFSTKQGAQEAFEVLDKAQTQVSGYRANVGALQNRFISTVESLENQHENLSAANSRIRDTDIAQSTADSARNNILLQASTGILAQANQMPGLALKLIG
ncbi:MAG: flagellin FliC [Bdellovibrio sp. CG10_big_fil_rev_8_21_14_0_10_47_8]|nr:MAG: flagellin FliC [Bdellovibrio sp. CG10_big_fil_rev_8_21_14_0_10_47_8]